MRQLARITLLLLAMISCVQGVMAQYYSWGADRAALKWSRIENHSLSEGRGVSIIFPDSVEHTARRMMHYLSAVQSTEAEGFRDGALGLPFVVHPENFVSNGMVMWAPLRVEFLSTPAVDSYSMPWVKQLVAHEYRHAVQYNNLDKSTLKVLNYIIGEQGAAASLLFPPLYALEGDAVMIETAMSSYGRGLQPSFTIGYRAMGDEMLNPRDFLKWRCGSYLEPIPDHYRMGYQMMSYAYTKYGENILDKAFAYTARNPQFISPYSIALRKFYDTSTRELFYEAFGDLVEFWSPLSQVDNSAEQLSRSEERNFITYSTPMQLPSGEILALREDYCDPSRFVIFDPESGDERVVAHTGSLSSRPAYSEGRVWWSEYRPSALFAEDINSQICYMDLEKGRPQRLKGRESGLYPTPIGNSASHIAYVEYNPNGQYSVVELCDNSVVSRFDVTYPNEVHGMAWDETMQSLYLIVTGDQGMWIERLHGGDFDRVTAPAYVTLSSLSACNGVLYFGSVASGKDEVHALDLASGVERQLTQSKYGSFTPVASEEELYLTTYDRYGYHLATQDLTVSIDTVKYSLLPANVVNPPRESYSTVNLDSVRFDVVALRESSEEHPAERYHKAAHLINVHSWAPIRYNPLTLLSEMSLDIGLGATLVSQNLLSSCEGYLAYGWDHYEGSILQGGASYNGLGVVLDVAATYGGEQMQYLISDIENLDRYNDFTVSASLPLALYRGYHTRVLSLYGAWNYSNGLVPTGLYSYYSFNPATSQMYTSIGYGAIQEGLNKVSFGVTYADYARSATRDVATPWGYSLSAGYALNPTNSEFAQLLSLYGKIYTPGLAKNNSFTLAAAYQDAFGGFDILGYRPLSYMSSALTPRGYSYLDVTNMDYVAASANYSFPLCYPELGLFDLFYIKRLALSVGFDYASFASYLSSRSTIYSYGATLMTDLNALSLTSASTLNLSLSLFKPQEGNLYFQLGFGLPF